MKPQVALNILAVTVAMTLTTTHCRSQEKKAEQPEQTEQAKAENKIDSHLLRAIKGSPNKNNLVKAEDGRYLVDVSGTISKDLLTAIQSRQGEVVSSSEFAKTARIKIPLGEVLKVALDNRVKFISPASAAVTNYQQAPATPK